MVDNVYTVEAEPQIINWEQHAITQDVSPAKKKVAKEEGRERGVARKQDQERDQEAK